MRKMILTLILAVLFGGTCLAGVNPLYVRLTAKPSEDCFPPSALQLPELEVDFTKTCEECVLTRNTKQADFSITVEDPGCGWELSLYDQKGILIGKYKWTGSLENGLEWALVVMRKNTH